MNNLTILVSVSSGKDSTATLLLALKTNERVFSAFADTGNEHDMVYKYLTYLEKKLNIKIKRLKADFLYLWNKRKEYIKEKWPEKGVPDNIIKNALSVFEKGPTGNAFLDLCIIKGRFPSRMAQFCTSYLKTQLLRKYTNELVEIYGNVESWQGVRAEESAIRAKLQERVTDGEIFTIVRPILKWTAKQVFDFHEKEGIKPNPLYKLGMNRVGCMPCINVSKDELFRINQRFPKHIDRIKEWEKVVGMVSKSQHSTFFYHSDGKGSILDDIEWSKTVYGGKQYDLFKTQETPL